MTKVQIPITTSGYVLMSSDYSQQEPKITAFVSQDPSMLKAFKEGKDIYATIASLAFNKPYEECLEFNPITGANQPEGKSRRTQAKSIVLGITYGRSTKTIGDQLFGTNKNMSDDEKTKEAQKIYDAVLNAFPNLRAFMLKAQNDARKQGYVETILGRRRHIPDMQLPMYEFKPMPGYVNPDIDPLDPSTLTQKNEIPPRVIKAIEKEIYGYKYFGQVVKCIKRLAEEKIKVINNNQWITNASRKCVNCVDTETEILTTSGWRKYNEISIGDEILSYNLEENRITKDNIQDIIISEGEHEVVEFKSPTFSAVSTLNHKWVACRSNNSPRFCETSNIYNHKWPDYPILRVADNSFEDNPNYSDAQLKFIGWAVTDGSIHVDKGSIHLYQNVRKPKNKEVYEDMINTLEYLGLKYSDKIYSHENYHYIYINKCPFTSHLCQLFPDKRLTFEFVSTLSQRQAEIVMRAMLQGDGSGVDSKGNCHIDSSRSLCCGTVEKRDVFQYLAFIAGYATNSIEVDNREGKYPANNKLYDSMSNIPKIRNVYYNVTVLKIKRAQLYPRHKSLTTCNTVWCVTTSNHTWIARRNGKVYITGNSIVQGSAAELTKIAMLKIFNNKEWKELGARVLLPVHDELIAEVPIRNYKRAEELLSQLMSEAGNFLPFTISCDVTTTYKWYGLSYPCKYKRPEEIDWDQISNDIIELSPDEIKWIQYHLFEMEYSLPIIPNEDGSKLEGDDSLGVNGKWSCELKECIYDYMDRYRIHPCDFLDNIYHRVNGDVL